MRASALTAPLPLIPRTRVWIITFPKGRESGTTSASTIHAVSFPNVQLPFPLQSGACSSTISAQFLGKTYTGGCRGGGKKQRSTHIFKCAAAAYFFCVCRGLGRIFNSLLQPNHRTSQAFRALITVIEFLTGSSGLCLRDLARPLHLHGPPAYTTFLNFTV